MTTTLRLPLWFRRAGGNILTAELDRRRPDLGA